MAIDYSFLMMDSSDSQCGCSDSQEPCEYEENEVVWAKIKGYPWWPAYVGQIISKKNSVALYKIYYFGYDSHSLLAFGNIRKFEPHFPEFFAPSKKNQRLKSSILNAIELLKKNNEDISYFDNKISSRRKKSELPTIGTPVKQETRRQEQPFPHLNSIDSKIEVEKGEKRKRGRPKKNVKQQQAQQSQNKKEAQIKLTNYKAQDELSPISTEEKIPIIVIPQAKKLINSISNIADYIVTFPKQEIRAGKIDLKNKQTMTSENSMNFECNIDKNKSQLSYQKDVKIQQLNRLLTNKLFKKAFSLSRTLKISSSNVLQFLDQNILAKINQVSNKKPFVRLKNKLKKALIDKYFNRNCGNQFSKKNYDSHRGKTIRQLYRILRSTNPKACKNLATICEQKIHLKNSTNPESYKQDIVNMVQCLRTEQLKSYVEIELSHLNQNSE